MKNIGYVNPQMDKGKPFEIMMQLHKGSSTTNVQSYTPTAEEIRMQKAAADYAEYVAPNAQWLNDTAADILKDSIGAVQVDFNSMNNSAQQQIANAQQGVQNLANGVIPSSYQTAMEDSIRSGVQNTMGTALNGLAGKGVLNSSVTNQAMNDISKNASNTMAEQYSNNISTLNGLYGQQSTLANSGITTAAAAQEAAQQPALNLWNASLGLNGATTSALSAVSGQGTTTSTSTTSGGSGWLGGLVGLGSSFIAACFTDDTKIDMADGTQKRIADIEVGDKVMCYDKDKDDAAREVVVGVSEPRYDTTYAVVCVDENKAERTVYTTLTQPLLAEAGEFVDVALLRIGAMLKGVGKVVGIVESGERKVYDFKTNGTNCYFANGFIAMGANDEELA